MREKININNKEKKEIYDKYISGVSMRKIEQQYPYSFTFIQKIIKSYEFENKLNFNYPLKDNFEIVAVCKKTNKIFNDYKNQSGILTRHLISLYPNINIPSNYKRKSIEYKTGKFWYDEYFEFIYEPIKNTKKCFYCDWNTTDINNKSGAYEKHLKEKHNKTIEDYLKDNPNDKNYFKHQKIKNGVKCKICGKELKVINNTHLKKHGLTVTEYKLIYGGDIVSKDSLFKMQEQYIKHLKYKSFKNVSNLEKIIVKEIQNDIDLEISNRSILDGMEIDIFSKEKNIGFEINGCLHHTEFFGKKNKNYHLNKTLKSLNKNVYLYHIFEDEIYFKYDIVISKIKHILNIKNNIKKIHGRKCDIVFNINKEEKKYFLNKNHIQGNDRSNYNIAAYYNGNLVGLMCFNNNRNMNKNKNHNKKIFELTRFCVEKNTIVNGIASKLIKNFIMKYNPNQIISFADIRWTPNPQNNLYTKLGFSLDKRIPPDYTYYNSKINPYKRFHKFNFGKKKIKKKYPEIYNDNKTEFIMMRELGYDKIWDCGKYRYVLNIKKGD